ncbi:hypothetical protein AADZ90_008605 [Aestuariibius sp. 2305UL40-4]|uniref:hypothetical protein n=1 Tax=Aestuariibius violaceus TaxID=3234132 RepID=UPI00398F6C21
MFKILLPAAVAALIAAPALASDQLAAQLGVAPGTYSTSELIQLSRAVQDNDHQRIRQITGGAVPSTQSVGISAGHAQLAAQLGVDPASYSVNELIVLRRALEDNDSVTVNRLTGGSDAIVSTRNTPGAGHMQLAAQLGVDPMAYTTAELTRMTFDRFSDDD